MDWALHCRNCGSLIASLSDLQVTLIGCAGIHMNLKRGIDLDERIEKIQNPDPRKRVRIPFKAKCRQPNCQNYLGSYMNDLLSFSANEVFFKSRHEEKKWNKWSKALKSLEDMGISIERPSKTTESNLRHRSIPLVYLNCTLTSKNTIVKLTKDKPRDYQRKLFLEAMTGNSLVYLPTGCGKTLIAAMAIACMSFLNPTKVAVFLAPKIPLVQQQFMYLKEQLPNLKVLFLTGQKDEEKVGSNNWGKVRQALEQRTVDVMVMSAEIFVNFLVDNGNLLKLADVSTIVFDEAHNCTGQHSYARIMTKYSPVEERFKPLILALSASPVNVKTVRKDQITDELDKLLDKLDCKVLWPCEQDLSLFLNRPSMTYVLKEHDDLQRVLENDVETYLQSLLPYLERFVPELSELKDHKVQSCNYKGILRRETEKLQNKQDKIQELALAEHVFSILSVLEVNTIIGCEKACENLFAVFRSIEEAGNPMDKQRQRVLTGLSFYERLIRNVRSLKVAFDCSKYHHSNRFDELRRELRQFAEKVRRGNENCRGIVFVNMRKTCTKLCEAISTDPLICEYLKPERFVGRGKGTQAMEWTKEQKPVLTKFRNGKCKLLISTSVLEEGLDIPACNLVIRFDSIMSMRALIQSRGRAARCSGSRFIIMCNDDAEMSTLKELEIKERNMEDIIKEKARSSMENTRGCETQKLDRNTCLSSPKKRSRQKRRASKVNKRKNLAVSVTVYYNKNDGKQTVKSCIQPLRSHFDISISEPKSKSLSPYGLHDQLAIKMDVRPQQGDKTHRNSDQLFDDIVRTWCEVGPSMWLERDTKPLDRNMVFHIVPIQLFAGGDFENRTVFSEEWQYECNGGAEILFLHDLKLITIVFKRNDGSLYKIEFRYDQMHEFVVLSVPNEKKESIDLFFSLRNVPMLSAATKYVYMFEDEAYDCSFTEYYLRGDSDSEDEEVVELDEEDNNEETLYKEDLNENDDWSAFANVSLEEEPLPLYEPNLQTQNFSPIHENDEILSDDSSSDSESESNEEQSSFSAEQTSAVERLVGVKKWSRRVQIEEGKKFGKFLSLRVRVPYTSDLYDALEALKGYGKRIFYAPVAIKNHINECYRIAVFSQEVQYAHQCFIGLNLNVRCRLTSRFYDLLTQISQVHCVNSLYHLSSTAANNYFMQPEEELSILVSRRRSLTRAHVTPASVPSHCALVKRLVLTPTRVIPFPPEVMETNRVLRNYDPQMFMSVSIREEDYSKLRGQNASLEVILQDIKSYMLQGLPVANRVYHFLGCSNSQMRSHGCWFFEAANREETTRIRVWMGDLSGIRCIASYMSRLGQCFSTSIDTVGVLLSEDSRCREIPDVKDPYDVYCFSDGVGTISTQLIKEVCIKVGKSSNISALQIRFAGCKGVLCVDPTLRGKQICIRPSMKKFESDHKRVELLQTSRPQAAYLNQQIIMLLSNLGVQDEVFIHLQEKMLDNLAAMMLNESEALQRMSSIIRTGVDYKSLSNHGVSLTTEPYMKSLMCALYRERIYRLMKKSRILVPVNDGRLMMGVMDETGLLEDGQVFLQCSHMTSEGDEENLPINQQSWTVNGSVMVTRNPCLHPGDVRQLEAVDIFDLHHIVDCIVFPQTGSRPHPNEMAGGDLDGDLYFVTWNKDFQRRRNLHKPMKYPALPKKEKNGPITVQDMADFYAEYIEHDALGIIDNKHKAYADYEEEGVESPNCLKLAELHSLAVDAPKTGVWPASSPPKLPPSYPDFMMVAEKPIHISHKVLGRLFHEVRDFEEIVNDSAQEEQVQIDCRLIFPGYQQYSESAAIAYTEYALQLQNLMTLYGIKSEGEMLSGYFYKLKGEFGRERSQIAVVVRKLIHQLRREFRTSFFSEFQLDGSEPLSSSQVTDKMKQKASAWYHYVYKPADARTTSGSKNILTRFLSFPWVVDDVLIAVLSSSTTNVLPNDVTNSVARDLSHSILTSFIIDSSYMLDQYQYRLDLLQDIADAISRNCPHYNLVMFGSSANFLFRPDSDLDVCVVHLQSRAQVVQIDNLQQIQPILRRCFGGARLIADAKVPVIRMGKIRSSRSFKNRLSISCDVSANINGFLKTYVLFSYYKRYPWLLPLIRFVIMWAYVSGLLQKLDGVYINTNVFVFMILSFCIENNFIKEISNVIPSIFGVQDCQNVPAEMFDAVIESLKNVSDSESPCIGEILLEFFKNRQQILHSKIHETFQELLGAQSYTDLLSMDDVNILCEQMQKAYHILAIHGSSKVLLDISSARVQRVFTLSSLQSLEIISQQQERSRARELSKKSGAFVRIRPQLPGSSQNLIVEARGNIGSIRVLERVLNSDESKCQSNKVSTMSKCFIRGSSMITFDGCHNNDDHVILMPYNGNHHQTHDQRIRHIPLLENGSQTSSICDFQEIHVFKSVRTKFLDQLKVVTRDHDKPLHGDLEFVVHFGRIYAFDIPNALNEDSEPMTITDFQYSAVKGRNPRKLMPTSRRNRQRRPGASSGLKKPKSKRKQKIDAKPVIDKTPNHSLFTVISEQGSQKVEAYLRRKGYIKQNDEPTISYTATVKVGSSEYYACYDELLQPTKLQLPRLRWFLADIKRPWVERHSTVGPSTGSGDGVECDVRFILGTSREFPPGDIETNDETSVLKVLSMNTSGLPYPFITSADFEKRLQLVRRKEKCIYQKLGHRTQVCISKVKEYSRLKKSTFRKVFERQELVIRPELPADLDNETEVDEFLKKIWKKSFKLAKLASA